MNHVCPICLKEVEAFRPFGNPKRQNAQCPHCGGLERHRLAWCFFKGRTNLFDQRPKRLLHVAPERTMSKMVSAIPGIDYLSADLDSRLAMVKMDLTDILFKNEYFDVILCSHVLEHIPDDAKAMSEMYRVLRPGGWAAIQVPVYGDSTYENSSIISPDDRLRMFGQRDHVRKYGRDITGRLSAAGFVVEHVLYAQEVSEVDRKKFALKAQDIFYCTKDTPMNA